MLKKNTIQMVKVLKWSVLVECGSWLLRLVVFNHLWIAGLADQPSFDEVRKIIQKQLKCIKWTFDEPYVYKSIGVNTAN